MKILETIQGCESNAHVLPGNKGRRASTLSVLRLLTHVWTSEAGAPSDTASPEKLKTAPNYGGELSNVIETIYRFFLYSRQDGRVHEAMAKIEFV